MLGTRLFLCHLLLALAAVAHPTITHHPTFQQGQIEWKECSSSFGNPTWDCGNVTVPLDYSNPSSNETHIVKLWRSKATKPPAKGSILLNFGGPGWSGLGAFHSYHFELHNVTGGYYDLILFSPRGTSEAGNLRFSCFETQDKRDADDHDRQPGIGSWNSLASDLTSSWAHRQAYANLCWNGHKDKRVGELIGTTFVARDMIKIVDALGEDGMLRFWGMSYGSILGATVAAMFPDRIHRLIVDSVANIFNYYDRLAIVDTSKGAHNDAAYRTVLLECLAAGPEICALAQDVKKDIPLEQQAWDLSTRIDLRAQRLWAFPIVVNTTVVDGDFVLALREKLRLGDEQKESPRDIALYLHHLLNSNENLTHVVDFVEALENSEYNHSPEYDDNADEALYGIRCSDKTGPAGRTSTVQDAIAEATLLGNTGDWNGWHPAATTALCADWPWKSKESFNTSMLKVEGGLQTKNPILLLGNTNDVRTPINNARNLSTYLAGSFVLEQKGVAHGTIDCMSNCTKEVIARYFLDGIFLERAKSCGRDRPMFRAKNPKSPAQVNHFNFL